MTPLQILRMYPDVTVSARPDGSVELHDPQRRPALAAWVRARKAEILEELSKKRAKSGVKTRAASGKAGQKHE